MRKNVAEKVKFSEKGLSVPNRPLSNVYFGQELAVLGCSKFLDNRSVIWIISPIRGPATTPTRGRITFHRTLYALSLLDLSLGWLRATAVHYLDYGRPSGMEKRSGLGAALWMGRKLSNSLETMANRAALRRPLIAISRTALTVFGV